MRSKLITKSKVSSLALCLLLGSTGALVATPSASADNCVGESREGESRYEPIGPGNGPRKVETFYLNSCEARVLHDKAAESKDGDALISALLAFAGKGGPLFGLAHVIGSRVDSAIVTSEVEKASNNFTKGVIVTTEGGSITVGPQ